MAERRGRSVMVAVLAVTTAGLYIVYMYCTSVGLRGQDVVRLVNNQHLSWTAGFNNVSGGGGPGWAEEVLTARRAGREDEIFRLPIISSLNPPHIPTTYDFRDQHPSCQHIPDVEDPSGCSHSWVDVVASAASERLCVASGASVRARLGARDVTACCTRCLGPLHAWLYLNVRGFPENRHQGCPSQEAVTSCGGAALSGRFGELSANLTSLVRYYGTSAFLLPRSVESIQLEMMKYGPVVAVLDVYSDFYYYRTGVYQYKYGSYEGSMAVKMIGWGHQSGLDYWLAVTSRSHHWGDRDVFKIRRGTNECKVEDDVTAGHMLPRLEGSKLAVTRHQSGATLPFVKFPQSSASSLVRSCWIGMTDPSKAYNTALQ